MVGKKREKNIEKISGSDIVFDILELANENNYSIFLFGGKPGVSSMAANNIKKKYPNITLIYDYSPVFGYEKEISEIDKCIDYINRKKPDIVFLCTGTPKTEKFFGYFQ